MSFRIITLPLCLTLLPFLCFSQSWYKQEILNEISIELPGVPERTQINSKTQAYDFISECCLFNVGVTINAIQPYSQYDSLSDTDRIKFLDAFLNNVAAGIILEGKQYLISAANRQLGKLLIKEIVFSDKDPKLKDSKRRYSALVLINNHLYTFSCWYRDDQLHEEERKRFFQSIRVR